MTKKAVLAAGLLVLFLVSCVTVNLYFPASEMRKAADRMVDEELKGKPADQQPKSQQGSSVREHMNLFSFGPAAAHAAEVDVNVSTPTIRALRESLINRFQELRPYFDKGALGSTNNGYIAIRDASSLTLRERAEVNTLIDAQNKDRKALYEEIVAANRLGRDAVPRVEKTFAASWRDRARPGWWVQQDDGQWMRK
ncbi:MAG: hypothetical protein FD164_716 [Nitrospirae bacterium]|nr:MAG: hypothetical protein FD164_716 [Nitrospirota bacterium]